MHREVEFREFLIPLKSFDTATHCLLRLSYALIIHCFCRSLLFTLYLKCYSLGCKLRHRRLLKLNFINVKPTSHSQLPAILEEFDQVEAAFAEDDDELPAVGFFQVGWRGQVVAYYVPHVSYYVLKLKPSSGISGILSSSGHDAQEVSEFLNPVFHFNFPFLIVSFVLFFESFSLESQSLRVFINSLLVLSEIQLQNIIENTLLGGLKLRSWALRGCLG